MEFITAFFMGLLGSFHCAGMCGPIVLSLWVSRGGEKTAPRILKNQLIYNGGRLISYGLLGIFVGAIGWSIHLAGLQRWLSIGTGIGMVLAVFLFYGIRVSPPKFLYFWLGRLKRFWPKMKGTKNWRTFLALGFFNGFLPCGFVYLALATAVTMASFSQTILFMVCFGLGTLPMMASLAHFGHWARGGLLAKLPKALPVLTLVLGLLLILRGLSLNIPYLSPNLSPKGCSHCGGP